MFFDYERTAPINRRGRAVAGWVSLFFASISLPSDKLLPGSGCWTIVLAGTLGIYGVLESRGRSIPAWGGIIIAAGCLVAASSSFR